LRPFTAGGAEAPVGNPRYYLVELDLIEASVSSRKEWAGVRSVVGGRDLDLTADEVISGLRGVAPETIREHFVVIDDKPFPPKQALAQVTGWGPADLYHHGGHSCSQPSRLCL
jgi:hypothetical protein